MSCDPAASWLVSRPSQDLRCRRTKILMEETMAVAKRKTKTEERVSTAELLKYYRDMLLIRRFE